MKITNPQKQLLNFTGITKTKSFNKIADVLIKDTFEMFYEKPLLEISNKQKVDIKFTIPFNQIIWRPFMRKIKITVQIKKLK